MIGYAVHNTKWTLFFSEQTLLGSRDSFTFLTVVINYILFVSQWRILFSELEANFVCCVKRKGIKLFCTRHEGARVGGKRGLAPLSPELGVNRGKCLTSRSGRFILETEFQYLMYRQLVGPQRFVDEICWDGKAILRPSSPRSGPCSDFYTTPAPNLEWCCPNCYLNSFEVFNTKF